jgi:hypothetical protein
MIDPRDLVRSVLMQETAEAACGMLKVFTREDVDVAVGSKRKICRGCLAAVGDEARAHDTTIRTPRGWLALLEEVHARSYAPPAPAIFSIKWSSPTSGHSYTTFPPAA